MGKNHEKVLTGGKGIINVVLVTARERLEDVKTPAAFDSYFLGFAVKIPTMFRQTAFSTMFDTSVSQHRI